MGARYNCKWCFRMNIRPANEATYDLVALGEVMLRFDPGDSRIHTARQFQVWEGGGEYNVARGLTACFKLRTALISAFPDNPIGQLCQNLIQAGGVDQSHCIIRPFDGIGRETRLGLNFTERGFGPRAAVGISDRANSAASQLKPDEIDWDQFFTQNPARWFHTGGIFAALSETTAEVALEALQAAKNHGVVTSYDLNYRPSLWKSIGGQPKAQSVNRELAKFVDVMIGNEEDFTAALGFEVQNSTQDHATLDPSSYQEMIAEVQKTFPNIKAVATTLRIATNASENSWSAILQTDNHLYQAPNRDRLPILDRVGGGDSFASGLIYGFLQGKDPQFCVDCGSAHGALAMSTPGDTSMATLDEVLKAMKPGTARIDR